MRAAYIRSAFICFFCFSLHGCSIVPQATTEELLPLDSPPPDVRAKIDRLFPRTLAWYEAVETELLPQGRPLSAQETQIARKLGVMNPDKVRVVVLEVFPMPQDLELLREAQRYGLGDPLEGGRTHGYLIMLKPKFADNKTMLTHELVHVGQQDRLGRQAFLRRYLIEMETFGYARSPLELEAYVKQDTAP